jgi:hypothetical protein
MKGIYLTAEAKQEIEAKLKQIRINDRDEFEDDEGYLLRKRNLERDFINNLLLSATILPVEDEQTYEDIWFERFKSSDYDTIKKSYLQQFYPQGVIIQPKQ